MAKRLRNLYKGKKASIQDLIFIATILFGFSIMVLIGFKISTELNDRFQTDDTLAEHDPENRSKDSFEQINNMFPNVIDNSFLFLAVGLSIVAFALASMVRIHPVFFIFFIIILVIIIVISGVFSNIYQEMALNDEMAAVAGQLIFITNILRFLPFIVGTMGMILSLVMYKTWQNG